MSYIDVVFPLNLGPLTYRCPRELEHAVRPGMLVSAPLKKGGAKGIVLATGVPAPSVRPREIREVCGDTLLLGQDLLELIRWMADYYIAPEGMILKQTLPQEIFRQTRERKSAKQRSIAPEPAAPSSPPEELAQLVSAAGSHRYQTFLVHAPSIAYEHALALGIVMSGLRNIIIVFPETAQADRFFAAAAAAAGDRACILHSGITRGKRSTAVGRIIEGSADIVIGTRAALFSPLRDVSVIMVMQEHSRSYKLEEGVRYHIRDSAVMRGFLGKAVVVLSSASPTVDSWYNAHSGKYRLLQPSPVPRPRVRVLDMRREKRTGAYISGQVLDLARRNLRDGKRTIFVVNRRGYATLLCRDCGLVESCSACSLPLILHKDASQLKCHTCGASRPAPQRCGRCGGHGLEPSGAGTQRIQEEIESNLGAEALRFDSDRARGASEVEELLREASAGSRRFIIGTKMMTRRLGAGGGFSSAAVLNPDAALSLPDFRAAEKAYMELTSVAGLIRPEGEVLLQTRVPSTPLYRHFRDNDYAGFARAELQQRRAMGYPPFSRLLTIAIADSAALAEKVIRHLAAFRDLEVLGPSVTRTGKGAEVYSLLLKSSNRKLLNEAAREVLGRFGTRSGTAITADVDPC